MESMPCPHNVSCLHAFRDPGFLARLAGKTSVARQENLLELESSFDPLGMWYQPVHGVDPYAAERRGLRSLLADYLHVSGLDPPPYETAGEFLRESDWMLPW
jgi:hypothetical protein